MGKCMKVLLFLTIFFLPYAFGMDLEELSFASFLKRQALCKRDVKVGDSDALIRETIDALCLNQDQAVTYLKERLMRREERLFKDTISQLVKRNRQFAVDVVLGIFASYIEDREYEEYLAVTGRNGQLSMLYYSLSSLFPKLNEYYTSTGRYCLLTIRGVERVIGLLNEKKNYFKDVPCAICSDLDELTESIKTKAAEELNQDMRSTGAIAGMITNGYLLNVERIERLNQAGLDHLQISIDNLVPDEVSKKSLKVLDKKLEMLVSTPSSTSTLIP